MRQRRAYSRVWNRPNWVLTTLIALGALCVSVLMEKLGVSWKYSEIWCGTAILLWLLLSFFRPEWRRLRFWMVLAAIIGMHLCGWAFLAARIERFGFALMFVLLVVELVLGASLIAKAIPEDERSMLDHIDGW